MSGGNIQAGIHRKRFIHQEFFVDLTTGEGLGSQQTPYTPSMQTSYFGSRHELVVVPWQASLVGVVSLCENDFRVEDGSLQVEVSYWAYPDGEWQGWWWSPNNCIVDEETMSSVGDMQWEAWTYDNGEYLIPAKAALAVRLVLVDCKLGDGTATRWMVQIVAEPTR